MTPPTEQTLSNALSQAAWNIERDPAKAADLAQQVITKAQGKRELTSVVEQAKTLLKKAETAQEEFEKVNIQNR